ncbi:MAG: 30S ribosomal protein S13 [bacterium]|nr:30S ribosomal protein S13 [bacterium]MDZ4231960.1 30S ribosomal protein S13 [Candidatus Pacearchaeota archaeon]
MPRLFGVTISDDKPVSIALTAVYGIGRASVSVILKEAKVDPSKRAGKLTPEELAAIREIMEKKYETEGDLRRKIMMNVRRLKNIGSWRGHRHTKGLPVRGQQTRTNSRTVRGNVRKTVGSGRKPTSSPT